MRLLVIAADRKAAAKLCEGLEQMKLLVEVCESKPANREKVLTNCLMAWQNENNKSRFNEVVLLVANGEDSLVEVIAFLRGMADVPLMVCSRDISVYEEMQCLQAGADDYQSIDCPPAVLRIRLERLVRLYQGRMSGAVPVRELLEQPGEQQFYYENHSLELTGKEYQVLYWLVHSQEEIIPKAKLLYHIWGQETPRSVRALDTVIKQLRKKLAGTPVSICTCYGKGYRLENIS